MRNSIPPKERVDDSDLQDNQGDPLKFHSFIYLIVRLLFFVLGRKLSSCIADEINSNHASFRFSLPVIFVCKKSGQFIGENYDV
ncbi:MAG TPA: hypothetical protein DDZ97_03095 [Deltaproteobacteria bacterium]|nr:hypothetical protein [Deltaproteobacteria bacterium]